jgi:hypothetical protein
MAKKSDQLLEKLNKLLDHYTKGKQDMDTRRTRKNGWNDIVNAYMGKIPKNWPYMSVVTDPVIRTTILEKNNRLINAKLQGRLEPREGGDMIKAKINNAILDYQWDNANEGGSMLEKVSLSDLDARLFGIKLAYVYWDDNKNCNEMKPCDIRDVFIDPAASHIRNAKWVQYREFSTIEQLEAKGYDVEKLEKTMKAGISQVRQNEYEDQVKINRGLEDRVGDDLSNPVIEVITEWTKKRMVVFAPKYDVIIEDKENPYEHGNIPFAQLRYYPLGDDIYGESEVESVIPLSRAINSILAGSIDEANIRIRPPLKVVPQGTRIETIEYGPGARWIMNSLNNVGEMQFSDGHLANFNAMYPALKAAFNTAMGDSSLGVSNGGNKFDQKTATEVKETISQQNNRDQANQFYLGEYLKDIMMMWVSNNKQFLFDDPSKKFHIIKIIGKNNIQSFQQMQLDGKDVPPEAMQEIEAAISENPEAVSPDMIGEVMNDAAVPTNPVFADGSPESLKGKLDVKEYGDEADLYVEPDDMVGVYDYIPDIKSMATGAGITAQQGRMKAYELILANPNVLGLLSQQGESLKAKELLINILTDAGERDAEGLFQTNQPDPSLLAGGPGAVAPGQPVGGPPVAPSMGGANQALPAQPSPAGIPPAQGLPF